MKHITAFFAIMTGLFLLGCEKEPEQGGQDTSGVPFSSVKFTIGEETVEGVVSDRTITIQFQEVEDFTSASMTIELNPGYTLTYPTDLDNVNLAEAPVLNFRAPDNSIVKYTIVVRSFALLIADASLIQVNSLEPGQNVSFDNAAKQIVVKFDKAQMKPEDITLTFNEGALQTETTAQEDLTFDFTEGLVQPLVFTVGDQETEYSVKLDVTSVIPYMARSIGFTDETSSYISEAENLYGIEVYRTNAPGIPVPLFCLTTCWMGENPFPWDANCQVDPDGDGVKESDNDYLNTQDGFSFMGDWTADRRTMMCTGEFLIVTFDQNSVAGNIVSDQGLSLDVNDMTNLIAVSGARTAEEGNEDDVQRTIYVDGSYIYQEKDPASGEPEYRGALGFDGGSGMYSTMTITTDGMVLSDTDGTVSIPDVPS